MKDMSIHILRSGEIIFLPALAILLSITGCGLIEVGSKQEQSSEIRQRASSQSGILASEPVSARPTLGREKSIKVPGNEDDQVIKVTYTDVIGRGPRYYGVEYGWIDQEKELFLDRHHRLHGNVVRVQISQELFEPTNDNGDPNDSAIDFSLGGIAIS